LIVAADTGSFAVFPPRAAGHLPFVALNSNIGIRPGI
jgi:hypothetical protein